LVKPEVIITEPSFFANLTLFFKDRLALKANDAKSLKTLVAAKITNYFVEVKHYKIIEQDFYLLCGLLNILPELIEQGGESVAYLALDLALNYQPFTKEQKVCVEMIKKHFNLMQYAL
jgi:hypothetical protein